MYRLLIVDDEQHVVNTLYELFDSQQDMELDIIKCCSSSEALRVLGSRKIDIVMLDIRMPGVSGLEVFRQIDRNWPECRVIFLTGYSSFDDIYEVSKKEKVAYLLKTEDNKIIVESVRNAIAALERDRMESERISESNLKTELIQHLVHREILHEFVKGKHLEEIKTQIELYRSEFLFDVEQPVYLMAVRLAWNSQHHIQSHSLKLVHLRKHFERSLDFRFSTAVYSISSNTVLAFLQPISTSVEFIDTSKYIRECLNDIADLEKCDSADTVILFLESSVDWDQIGKYCDMLCQSLDKELHAKAKANRVLVIDEKKAYELLLSMQKHQFCGCSYEQLIGKLSYALNNGDSPEFNSILDNYLKLCEKSGSMRCLLSVKIYQSIGHVLIDCIRRYSLQEKVEAKISLYGLYYLDEFNDWNKAFDYLRKLTNILFELMTDEAANNAERMVWFIKNYIHDNLSTELSLTGISNMINYNSSYVSRTFRQLTGVSVSRYISFARVEKAKEYLKTTNMSMHEIAEKTGFFSSQYLSIVFRKFVGVTPRDYRCKLIPECK